VRRSRIEVIQPARRRSGGRALGPACRALGPVTAVATVCALIAVGGCADSGGVRLEGTAATASAVPSRPPTVTAGKVDAVNLLKQDPQVRADFKKDLKPCPGAAKKYPVEVTYGDLTDSGHPDVLINLSTCGGSMGLGVYAYQKKGNSYQNVFVDETPPVHGEIDDGFLKVTRQVYMTSDAMCCPTGRSVTTFAWTGGWFSEISHSRAEAE